MTTRLKRAPKRGTPPRVSYRVGPWIGMRDSADVAGNDPNYAKLLLNVYPDAPRLGAALRERPGLILTDDARFTNGHANVFHQLTKIDGTEHSFAIVGSKFCRYNWIGATWTEWVADAAFTSASISRAQWARYYGVTFADAALFSDGVNVPWTHDGTEAAGLTKLTNAPVFYGPPVVHYGKVFGIKNAERSTFVWSEEGTANTGYEAGGYNNAWTLRQTDTNQLVRLLPTNEALYVFRARSITAIYGEVNQNFSSTGTREAVSSKIGTIAPASVFFGGEDGELIFFADADGRPHVLEPGGTPIPIWEDARETLRTFDRSRFHEIEGYWDSNTQHAVFCFGKPGETANGASGLGYRSMMLRYHMHLGKPQLCSIWDRFDIARVGILKGTDGQNRVFHGESAGTSSWVTWQHALPDSGLTDNGTVGTTTEDSQVTENGNISIGVDSSQAFGFSFTTGATANKILRTVAIKLARSVATVVGPTNLVVRLRYFTGSYTDPEPGAIIAEENLAIADLVTSPFTEHVVTFSHTAWLNVSRQYMVTVEPDLPFVAGGVDIKTFTPDAHGGGTVLKDANGTWAASGSGMYFIVQGRIGAVEHRVETHPEPQASAVELAFDLLHIFTSPLRDLAGLTVRHVSQYSTSARADFDITAGQSLWDEAVWDTSEFDPEAQPRKTTIGIDAHGTGVGLVFSQIGTGLKFPLLSATLSGTPTNLDVEAR